MFFFLGAAVVTFIGFILAAAAMKPNSFRVERRSRIEAAPDAIYPWLESPRRAGQWSPWDKKDPAMTKTFSGAPSGVGAVYEWSGNRAVGAGRLEIVRATPPTLVEMDLRFLRPMEGRNVARYEIERLPDGSSEIRWSVSGPLPFLSKIMCVFIDMDVMIGRDFERGLADLKILAEKSS